MTSIPFWRPRTTDMVNWPAEPVRVPVGPGGCPPGTFPAVDRYGPVCAGIGLGPQVVYTEANAQLQPGPTTLGPEAMWHRNPRVSPRWQRATVQPVAPQMPQVAHAPGVEPGRRLPSPTVKKNPGTMAAGRPARGGHPGRQNPFRRRTRTKRAAGAPMPSRACGVCMKNGVRICVSGGKTWVESCTPDLI